LDGEERIELIKKINMKKWNYKQINHSQRKVAEATHNRLRAMFLTLSILFLVVTSLLAVVNHINPAVWLNMNLVNVSIAAMASIPQTDPDYSRNTIKQRLFLLRASDEVDWDNLPTANATTKSIGAIAALSGKYWHYIDCVEGTVKPNAKGVGTVAPSLNLELLADLAGINDDTLAFLYDNNGEKFIVGWENCTTGLKYVAISPCSNGLRLNIDQMGEVGDYQGAKLKFTATCAEPYYRYTGTFPQEAPETVAANAVTIALTTNNRYQLTDGSASAANITGFTGAAVADHGRVLEILGSGGTYPSTIDTNDNFVLCDGTTWIATAGAKLTVQVFKDGASTYKFIEVRGTRV
jgi:hypothetical protein